MTGTEPGCLDAADHDYVRRHRTDESLLAARPEGANHMWRRIPPRELSIDPVADERLLRVTARAIWIEAGSIRAKKGSGNGIVGEVHRSQSTNRLG